MFECEFETVKAFYVFELEKDSHFQTLMRLTNYQNSQLKLQIQITSESNIERIIQVSNLGLKFVIYLTIECSKI